MELWQALILALYYGFFSTKCLILLIGPQMYGSIIGLFVGIIMGDVSKGVAIGAAIHTIYLGVVQYGGTVPSDQFLACIIAIPLAIATGLDTETAVALAATFGALGVAFDTIWKTINTSVWSPYVDRCVEKSDYRGISWGAGLFPILTSVLLRSPIIFALLYFGTDTINWLVNHLPQQLLHGLSVMGAILPAMGFGIFISIIGRPIQIPFFICGFFVMKLLGLPVIGCAVFGFFLAYLSIVWVDSEFVKGGGN